MLQEGTGKRLKRFWDVMKNLLEGVSVHTVRQTMDAFALNQWSCNSALAAVWLQTE